MIQDISNIEELREISAQAIIKSIPQEDYDKLISLLVDAAKEGLTQVILNKDNFKEDSIPYIINLLLLQGYRVNDFIGNLTIAWTKTNKEDL